MFSFLIDENGVHLFRSLNVSGAKIGIFLLSNARKWGKISESQEKGVLLRAENVSFTSFEDI